MRLNGKLGLNQQDEYILFSGGRNINLSSELNTLLLSDVKIAVRDIYYDEVLFYGIGKLVLEKVGKCNYWYHVGDLDLDEVLWNNTGRNVEVVVVS